MDNVLLPEPYRWTLLRAWRGACDWLLERAQNPAASPPRRPAPPKTLLKVAMGSVGMLLTLWAAVVMFAPSLAQAAGTGGASGLLWAAALGLGGALMWAANQGVRTGKRAVQFVQEMGYRGWELETGRRVPIRRVL